jgi:hypothetical protein
MQLSPTGGYGRRLFCIGEGRISPMRHTHSPKLAARAPRAAMQAASEERDELAPSHEVASDEVHSLAHHRMTSAPTHRAPWLNRDFAQK